MLFKTVTPLLTPFCLSAWLPALPCPALPACPASPIFWQVVLNVTQVGAYKKVCELCSSSSTTFLTLNVHNRVNTLEVFGSDDHTQEGIILEEWVMSNIYSVNKKVKDSSKIEPSPSSYPCIVICISADDSTLLQTYIMFYSSPQLPDLAHHLADIPQKSSRCYPLSLA